MTVAQIVQIFFLAAYFTVGVWLAFIVEFTDEPPLEKPLRVIARCGIVVAWPVLVTSKRNQ